MFILLKVTHGWNTSTSEISYNSTKTFVIQHPIDDEKFLVHSCVEGDNTGLIYRGMSTIKESEEFHRVYLPNYVKHIGYNFTVNLTPKSKKFNPLSTEGVFHGEYFDVYGNSGEFYWHVFAMRGSLVVEPLKKEVDVKGSGPYTWI